MSEGLLAIVMEGEINVVARDDSYQPSYCTELTREFQLPKV